MRKLKNPVLLILPVLLCFAVTLPLLSAFGDVQQPDRAHRIGAKLRCMCNGYNDSVHGCYHISGAFSGPCDTALGMLKEIKEQISRGNSDDLIVQSFVQEYGQAVLMEPPHTGFGPAGVVDSRPCFDRRFCAGLGVISGCESMSLLNREGQGRRRRFF